MCRILAATVFVLLLPACGFVYQEEVLEQTFLTGTTPRVVVDNLSGHITVIPREGGEVLATIIKHGSGASSEEVREGLRVLQVELHQEADTLTLTTRRDGDSATEVWAEVWLQVPANTTLELRTGGGDITTHGLSGAHTLSTVRGGIQVTGDSKYLVATTRSGRISLQTSHAAHVQARTTHGNILYTGALAGKANTFETISGDVTLLLPSDSTFHLEAGTTRGQVHMGFPLLPERGGLAHLRGNVGHEPRSHLSIRVTQGDISVQPQPQPSDSLVGISQHGKGPRPENLASSAKRLEHRINP
jgi:hypothetical protein